MVGPKSKEPAGHDELKSAKAQEQSVLTAQTSVVFEFEPNPSFVGLFSFLYFLKIKISKIYVRFEIFQKYPQSPPLRLTGKEKFLGENFPRKPKILFLGRVRFFYLSPEIFGPFESPPKPNWCNQISGHPAAS